MKKTKTVNSREPETFEYQAALYFLTDQGHYLFRHRTEGGGFASKFIRHNDAMAAFHGVEVDSGWIDPNVRRFGADKHGEWFVFFMPPRILDVPFRFGNSVEVLRVPLPSTVLLGSNNTYYLYAIKGKIFKPKGQLCVAPFPNIFERGNICWGDTQVPKVSHVEARKAWELFFSSVFTSHLASDRVRGIKESCLPYWKELAERKARSFPQGRLLQLSKTVAGMFSDKLREEN